MAWHPPVDAPPGQPHGANAFCVTHDGEVVLVSTDGSRWEWPGGRPERGESWEDTLRREILEEACATITGARLLGFVRARCLSGRENGLVLVRSIWRAEVRLLPLAASTRDRVPARGASPRPARAPVDGRRRRADLLPRRPGGGT